MRLKGTHICYLCGHKFNWSALIKSGQNNAYEQEENESIGEAVATGNLITKEGKKVEYEVIVECARCGNKNKIKWI